jgi:hypothetical protein
MLKKTLLFSIAGILSFPAAAMSQQTYSYDVCTRYQETYVPGYYTDQGNYMPGRVVTQSFRVPCGTTNVSPAPVVVPAPVAYYGNPPPYYYRRRNCNPAGGALLGAGIAAALSGGRGYSNSGSWYRNYSRNGSSGGWSNSSRYNPWPILGAGLGSLAFSC